MMNEIKMDESEEVMLGEINIKYGKIRFVCCVN